MKTISLLVLSWISLSVFQCSEDPIQDPVPEAILGDWKQLVGTRVFYYRIHANGKQAVLANYFYTIKNDTLTFAKVSYWRLTGTTDIIGSWAGYDPNQKVDSVYFKANGDYRFGSTDGGGSLLGFYKVDKDRLFIGEYNAEYSFKGDSIFSHDQNGLSDKGTFSIRNDSMYLNLSQNHSVLTRFDGPIPSTD